MPMHVSLLLYIPSNNAGKNIITETFTILDSDPVYMQGDVFLVTRLLKIPWASQLWLHFFGKLIEQFLCETQTWLDWNEKSPRLARSLAFERRVTLLLGKTFCHISVHFGSPAQVKSAKCRFTKHENARTKMDPSSN